MNAVNPVKHAYAGTLDCYQHPSNLWAGPHFPSGVGGGSVFMDAGVELVLTSKAA